MRRQKHLGMNEIKKRIIEILSEPLHYLPYGKKRSGYRTTIMKPEEFNKHIKSKDGITKSNRKGTDPASSS